MVARHVRCAERAMNHPTLLRAPSWIPGLDTEIALLLAPEDYEIIPFGARVRVVERRSGTVVYEGIGPVNMGPSPAPF